MSDFDSHLAARMALMQSLRDSGQERELTRAIHLITTSLAAGRSLLVCGNGGSAADAEHIAGELVGRFRKQRRAYNALALVTNPAILSALSNDFGYDQVFSRQVEAYGREGGVLLVLSTSGNSPSVIAAAATARAMSMQVIGLSGRTGGQLAGAVDLLLRVPSDDIALIQEGHAAIYHYLCDRIEDRLSSVPDPD